MCGISDSSNSNLKATKDPKRKKYDYYTIYDKTNHHKNYDHDVAIDRRTGNVFFYYHAYTKSAKPIGNIMDNDILDKITTSGYVNRFHNYEPVSRQLGLGWIEKAEIFLLGYECRTFLPLDLVYEILFMLMVDE